MKIPFMDYNKLIDFINYAFCDVDFPTLLPKIYKGHPELTDSHYAIYEDQDIKAVIGTFDIQLNAVSEQLNVCGIGTVSSHRYHRNQGYMQQLINNALEDMKQNAVDFSVLGGSRHRYEYFDYTPVGIAAKNDVSLYETGHRQVPTHYFFKQITHSEHMIISSMRNLHKQQPVFASRENFYETSLTWNSQLFAVFHKEDFAGYIIANKDEKNISEIVLIDPNNFSEIVISFIRSQALDTVSILLQPFQQTEINQLNMIGDTNCHLANVTQLNVLNYKNTIRAFLILKAQLSPLVHGSFIINIEKHGRYKISYDGEIVSVLDTTENYDVSFNHLEAMQYLFSVATFMQLTANPVAQSWFPLPFCFPTADNV